MNSMYVRQVVLGCMIGLFCSAVTADTLKVSVFDTNGAPIEGAVVELITKKKSIAPSESVATVDQLFKRFVPEQIIVQQGQWVNFPNSDNIRHHVYSFSQAKSFELKLYSGRPKSPLLFDNSGIVVLGCNIHDSMVGYIYVAENNPALFSDTDGQVTFADATSGDELRLWYRYQANSIESTYSQKLTSALMADGEVAIIIETAAAPAGDSFQDVFEGTDN